MNFRDLEYIVSVARNQNFAKAAKESFVSQPALSMQIRKLEEELGTKIFERDQKKFLITEIGKEIVSRAEKILLEAAELKSLAQNSKDLLSGKLYLGAFPTLAAYFFPKLLKLLRQNFPNLRNFLVEEKTEELVRRLQSGELDCAFLAIDSLPETKSLKIFSERFLLAVPKTHDLAKMKKAGIKLEDLKNRELMLLDDGHCLRSQALEVCNLASALETEGFRASSLETLRQMVACGNGITLIPEIAVKNDKEIAYLPIYQNYFKLTKSPALVYQGSSSKPRSRQLSEKELYLNPKDSGMYQSSLKLEQNPALVYQGTPQRGDADISARKKLYWNPKDSGISEEFPKIKKGKKSLRDDLFVGREIFLHWRKNSIKSELISQIANLTKAEKFTAI